MDVRLELADIGQRDVVGRLLELNAYEFSRLDGRPLRPDGTFGYPYLDAYWAEPGRFPYLIRVGEELGGLALVRRDVTETSVAELLVLPKFRRRQVGARAAAALLALHPGRWRVSQVPGNAAATAFWRRVLPASSEESVAADGTVVQSFTSPGPGPA